MVLDGILTVVDSKHIVGQLQEDHLDFNRMKNTFIQSLRRHLFFDLKFHLLQEKPKGAVNEAVEQALLDSMLGLILHLISESGLQKHQKFKRKKMFDKIA